MKYIEEKQAYVDEHGIYYKNNDIQTIGVGEIPVGDYICNLRKVRKYNLEMINSHTIKLYGIDLMGDVLHEDQPELSYIRKNNIYEEYRIENPVKSQDTKTRQFFTKYARPNFELFHYKYFKGKNMVSTLLEICDHVHHILPLQHGGDNSLENLIYITEWQHRMLHENPCEHIGKANFEALDFMIHVCSPLTYGRMVSKYNLWVLSKENFEEFRDVIRSILESKIKTFYRKLCAKYIDSDCIEE